MSLGKEMARYEKLTGDSAERIPLGRLGGFLDGVDKGIEELNKIKAEFDNDLNLYKNEYDDTYNCSLDYIKGIITCKTIIDKYIAELKGEQE